MDNINIDLKLLQKLDININEYLTLWDIANNLEISSIFNYGIAELVSLEKKGLIKLTNEAITLRGKGTRIFNTTDELFEEWINLYPTYVLSSNGSKRALSPASSDTILGKRLKTKWNNLFKKDADAQRQAIEVLRAMIKSKTKDGSMCYFVEATRFLNEGFHEKEAHLIGENSETNNNNYGESEDWL